MSSSGIYRVPSPAICVIDDEIAEYEPILKALMRMGLAAVHIKGDNVDDLPPDGHPLQGLRIVFTDLNLNNAQGKTALSNTAHVFSRVVPADSGPVIVVIWSKIADDKEDSASGTTRADQFINLVLEQNQAYQNKLIFTKMPKPSGLSGERRVPIDWISMIESGTNDIIQGIVDSGGQSQEWLQSGGMDRFAADFRSLTASVKGLALAYGTDDGKWVETFQKSVGALLNSWGAFDILWKWESICQRAVGRAAHDLLHLALRSLPGEQKGQFKAYSDRLMTIFQELVRAQAGNTVADSDAPRHLIAALADIASDNIEHSDSFAMLSNYGSLLVPPKKNDKRTFAPSINTILLTAEAFPSEGSPPGTVYDLAEADEQFKNLFGAGIDDLKKDCCEHSKPDILSAWTSDARPVIVELSPACDVHNKKRKTLSLLAGLIVNASSKEYARTKDAWMTLPGFELRGASAGDGSNGNPAEEEAQSTFNTRDSAPREVIMVFCARYRASMPANSELPPCLKPIFRLRDLPTTALRNWLAGQSARAGFLSL